MMMTSKCMYAFKPTILEKDIVSVMLWQSKKESKNSCVFWTERTKKTAFTFPSDNGLYSHSAMLAGNVMTWRISASQMYDRSSYTTTPKTSWVTGSLLLKKSTFQQGIKCCSSSKSSHVKICRISTFTF